MQDRFIRLEAMTAALASAVTPSAVAEALLRDGLAAAGAISGALAVVSPESELKVIRAGVEWPASMVGCRLPLEAPGPLSVCVWTGEPVWIESPEVLRADYPHVASAVSHLEARMSAACLPLHGKGRTRGAVGFLFGEANAFPERERALLRMVVAQCTEALDRTRLYHPFMV